MESKKLYALIADGYSEGYGTELYLVGIFDNLDVAQKLQDECEKLGLFSKILETNLNAYHRLNKNNTAYRDSGYSNDLYLGGYIE